MSGRWYCCHQETDSSLIECNRRCKYFRAYLRKMKNGFYTWHVHVARECLKDVNACSVIDEFRIYCSLLFRHADRVWVQKLDPHFAQLFMVSSVKTALLLLMVIWRLSDKILSFSFDDFTQILSLWLEIPALLSTIGCFFPNYVQSLFSSFEQCTTIDVALL